VEKGGEEEMWVGGGDGDVSGAAGAEGDAGGRREPSGAGVSFGGEDGI